jgi:hypothetical protein
MESTPSKRPCSSPREEWEGAGPPWPGGPAGPRGGAPAVAGLPQRLDRTEPKAAPLRRLRGRVHPAQTTSCAAAAGLQTGQDAALPLAPASHLLTEAPRSLSPFGHGVKPGGPGSALRGPTAQPAPRQQPARSSAAPPAQPGPSVPSNHLGPSIVSLVRVSGV